MIRPLEYLHNLTEHSECEFEAQALLKIALDFSGPPNNFMGAPNKLGISVRRGSKANSIVLLPYYYIGATWLSDNLSAVVHPKINDIDFIQMFSYSLQLGSPKEREYFSKCYGIDIDAPEIEVDSDLNIITPLIMIHYVSLLEELIKHGLKKGYVTNECNLKSKIKGHILFSTHLSRNIIPKREDRNYCRFSEFTADIPENRLLKKALMFVQSAIKRYTDFCGSSEDGKLPIPIRINRLISHFGCVSDQISLSDVQKTSSNKVFSLYEESIRLAKLILRSLDNDVAKKDNSKEKCKVKPFWIDMPRLYEMYVYGKLLEMVKTDKSLEGEKIIFQCEGYGQTAADFVFVNHGIILDAKYKPAYEAGHKGLIHDVREMSGYARDINILNQMNKNEGDPVKAIILYPSHMENQENKDDEVQIENNKGIEFLSEKSKKIKPYKDFYKMPIEIPIKNKD